MNNKDKTFAGRRQVPIPYIIKNLNSKNKFKEKTVEQNIFLLCQQPETYELLSS